VESILASDGEETEQLMRIHLNNVRHELVRLLVNLVLPFVEEGV
jgi:DNA-binding GntR family transcriptional regulator